MIRKDQATAKNSKLHHRFSYYFAVTFGLLFLLCNSLSFANKIDWVTSATKGLEAAKNSDKLLMIDFYTDW